MKKNILFLTLLLSLVSNGEEARKWENVSFCSAHVRVLLVKDNNVENVNYESEMKEVELKGNPGQLLIGYTIIKVNSNIEIPISLIYDNYSSKNKLKHSLRSIIKIKYNDEMNIGIQSLSECLKSDLYLSNSIFVDTPSKLKINEFINSNPNSSYRIAIEELFPNKTEIPYTVTVDCSIMSDK